MSSLILIKDASLNAVESAIQPLYGVWSGKKEKGKSHRLFDFYKITFIFSILVFLVFIFFRFEYIQDLASLTILTTTTK